MLTRTRLFALLILSTTATGLTGCGGQSVDRPAPQADTQTTTSATPARSTTSNTSTPTPSAAARVPETGTSDTGSARPTRTQPSPSPKTVRPPDPPKAQSQRFVCPRGGVKEATALQEAVDQGHQPWRTSARDVAAACTFPDGVVKAVGANAYRVTRASTGETVLVQVAQPVRTGSEGIWVVTKVTPS